MASYRWIMVSGLLLAALGLAGCNQWMRAAEAHADARGRLDFVQRSNCAANQAMLNRAVRDLREEDPDALDGVATGSGEWFRVLERHRVLPMAMPCTGGGRYLQGPAGDVICSTHGPADTIDTTHPDSPSRDHREPSAPPEFTGEHMALGCWGVGLVFLLAAGYNYTAGGEDVDLAEVLRDTVASDPGGVVPDSYALVEGVAEAEESLLAPRARTQVVFYRYRQLEEWQEQDRNKFWHTVTRVLKEETEVVPFSILGDCGAVEVAAGGARLEGKRLLRDVVGASGSTTSLGGGGLGITGKYRNHRYIHEVEGLEVGQPALVVGPTAPGASGGARFEVKAQEERPYVVSARSRRELSQRVKDGAGVSRLLMYGFGALALFFLVAGFLIPTELGR